MLGYQRQQQQQASTVCIAHHCCAVTCAAPPSADFCSPLSHQQAPNTKGLLSASIAIAWLNLCI